MNDLLMECLTNPIKNKLLMAVKEVGHTTTKELAKKLKDIPQATLYRYLKKMVEDGLLKVARENQIRNVREKVYCLAIDFDAEIEKMNEDTTGRLYVARFKQFVNGLAEEFDENTPKDNEKAVYDGSGFFIHPFYATYDEVKELLQKIREVIEPYESRASHERQLRSMATIFMPPTKNRGD